MSITSTPLWFSVPLGSKMTKRLCSKSEDSKFNLFDYAMEKHQYSKLQIMDSNHTRRIVFI